MKMKKKIKKKRAVRKVRAPASADVLFEIGTEEIPARFLPGARRQLRDLAAKRFAGLASGGEVDARVWATPRRLVVRVKGVPLVQKARAEEVLGPPKSIAFGPDGKPTPALEGFARKCGVKVKALREFPSEKGPRMGFVKRIPASATAKALPAVLAGIAAGLEFPKSMRWPQAGEAAFARPIRWLLALFGNRQVKVQFGGLVSGRTTNGRRFFHPKPLPVKSVDDYFRIMKKCGIVLDGARRKDIIRNGADRLAAKASGRIEWDESLLGEVSDLVETPVPILGRYPREALETPKQVLVAAMQEHQRYFPVVDPSGRLLPCFVTVSNGVSTPEVKAGNQRVLKARLADARFFFREDGRKPFEGFLGGLKGAVWQAGAGSMFDKAQRLSMLASWLAGAVAEDSAAAERAAFLCKADLVTQMVGEFPTLQGVAGGFYASASGEQEQVARAVAEHYLPLSASGDIPSTGPGCVVALADKLDNLVGHFALGHAPTGAADPYALRRAAIGVLRIAIGRKWRLPLTMALGNAAIRFGRQMPEGPEWSSAVRPVRNFLRDRMAVMLAEDGFQHDEIEACLVDFNDALGASERMRALAIMKGRPDWRETVLALSRVTNILPKGVKVEPLKDPAGLADEEKALWDAHEAVREAAASLAGEGKFDELFSLLAGLKPAIDRFFEKVLVNDPDDGVRDRRMALVRRVAGTVRLFADIRALVIT